MKKLLILALALITSTSAYSQTYTQVQWGYNAASSSPLNYKIGTSWVPFNPNEFIPPGTGAIPTTVTARLAQTISAKDFATGNTVAYSDGAMLTGSNNLVSNAATFVSSDVGKYISIQGAGASGQSVTGTIAAINNSHSVRVSFVNSSGIGISGKRFLYGTDDTAGIRNAINYASLSGACVDFSTGGYWLASQTSTINLNYVCMRGVGSVEFAYPYVNRGSTIVITNNAVSPFTVQDGINISGMMFYYPEQDASQATPKVYPALFTGLQWSNDTFVDNVIVNAYDLFEAQAAGTFGRITLSNNKAYCVRYCFNLKAGNADQLQLDSNNIFSPGIYDYAYYSNGGVLGGWTGDNGEFVHFDGTNATLFREFSVNMNGGLVYGYRYGIRSVNSSATPANMYVSTLQNVSWDGVATVLSFENNTFPSDVQLLGGYIYSYRGRSLSVASATDPTVFMNSTCSAGNASLNIADVNFASSKGRHLDFQTNCFRSLSVKDNTFRSWGTSTTLGTYYSNVFVGPRVNIVGNTYNAAIVAGSTMRAILTYAGGNITGNVFTYTNQAIVNQGSENITVSDNIAYNSSGQPVFNGGSATIWQNGNIWDVGASNQLMGSTIALSKAATSGTFITLQNLNASGEYNFNLPATAGTAGHVLTSGGGGAADMTWTSPTITVNGTACSLGASCSPAFGGAIAFPAAVSGTTTSGGIPYFSNATTLSSSAVLGSGQIVVGGGAGSAPTTSANAILSSGALSLGAPASPGSISIKGSTSGSVNVTVPAIAGTTNFTLPGSNGTSGYTLTTDGSGVTSWGVLSVAAGGTGLTSGTSGGIPYFSAAGTMASSGALTANAIVLGGGAGASPTVSGCTITTGNSINCSSNSAFYPLWNITNTAADANSGGFIAYKSKGGATTDSTSRLFNIAAYGFGSSAFGLSAQLQLIQDGASSGNNVPGAIQFVLNDSTGATRTALKAASTGIVTMPSGIASTSSTTGTLVVTGGVGASGAIYGGGIVSATTAINVASALPTISACGTTPPAATAGSSNNAGQFTLGTGTPTACTVTFNSAYANNAYCTVTPASNYTGTYYISAQSRSAFTVTLGTGTSSAVFNYTCFGN